MVETMLQRAPDNYAIRLIDREPHGNYKRVLLLPGEKASADTLIISPK